METTHTVVVGDSRDLPTLEDDSVDLVVTSPPYPMIEMWDDLFVDLDPAVDEALETGDGQGAFELMHAQLARVWEELSRVVTDGGIVCLNVGDATRTLDGTFRVYPNHARVLSAMQDCGFDPLPDVLWRKPSNSGAKFMGSGTLPPNAYVTLEHEYVLVFRQGDEKRSFEPGADRRYEAAYFWEERNRWFSDVWTDVNGELQTLDEDNLRERSGAYPFSIPYRLVCMYSAYGDTVFDPFWGTGTTSLAAICAARNSIGVERDPAFAARFDSLLEGIDTQSREVAAQRLSHHRDFVDDRRSDGKTPRYEATHYDTDVVTKMERDIRLYEVEEIERRAEADGTARSQRYGVFHTPFEDPR